MKKKYLHIGLLAAMLPLISIQSCSDRFLEIEPKGVLIAKKTNDYNLLLNNSAASMYGLNHVLLGDEVISMEPHYSGTPISAKQFFQYADDFYQAADVAAETEGLLPLLYTYNKIINEVMVSEGGSEEQKKAIRAEAMVNRAWIYLLLINFYGKPYQASTAGTDLGFFIITTSDVTTAKFERPSVQAVYDFILNDLNTALPDLPYSLANRMRMSKSAAESLLGKTYWFMGKYQEALVHFDKSFETIPKDFPVKLFDYKTYFAPDGPWGYDAMTSPDDYLSGPENGSGYEEALFYKAMQNGYGAYFNDFMLSPKTLDLFKTPNNSDERLKFFSDKLYGGGEIGIEGLRRRIGLADVQLGMTLPDLYLMRAECRARTNDLAGAKVDLETLRKKRMSESDAVVHISSATAMIKFIIEERVREFALQGYRWFDMRRLSVDPLFAQITYTHQVLTSTGNVKETFPLRPERFTFRIPLMIMDQNPGVVNNP